MSTLKIQKEKLPTMPVAMIGPSTMTETTNKIAITKTTKTIKTTSNAATII
jgi:hypothetical protein